MSMMYCHKHDRHYDTDYDTECPRCEEVYSDREWAESYHVTGSDLPALRELYLKSEKDGLESFEYNGHTVLTKYAKYLIEYLESC